MNSATPARTARSRSISGQEDPPRVPRDGDTNRVLSKNAEQGPSPTLPPRPAAEPGPSDITVDATTRACYTRPSPITQEASMAVSIRHNSVDETTRYLRIQPEQ